VDLAMVGADPATILPVEDSFVVRIGPLSTRRDAERLKALLVFWDPEAVGVTQE